MAFAVRTAPTGPETSLADVAFADDYFTDRGITAWTSANPTDKQTWLIQATDYIDIRFAARYTDDVLGGTSEYPLVPGGTIPIKLARAACEYAIRAKGALLAPDPTVDASGVAVVNTMKKLGPLEREFKVLGSGYPHLFRAYPAADALLAGLLKPAAGIVYR